MTEGPLPHIIESMDELGGRPKDRLVSILDRIETHVEQLRKDAMRIEEEKDTLLTTLDTLRNNDVVVALEDSELPSFFFFPALGAGLCVFLWMVCCLC